MKADDVIRQLWSPSNRGEIYFILDCARDEGLFPSLSRSPLEYRCLYEDDRIGEPLRKVAPYLVRLQPWGEYTSWLLGAGWGKSWGVLLSTNVGMNKLRKHLRRFLLVVDEAGRQLYFRYYDPRVLRPYLPTCTPAEADAVFGPIDRFWSESEDGHRLIEFAQGSDGVRRVDIPLA